MGWYLPHNSLHFLIRDLSNLDAIIKSASARSGSCISRYKSPLLKIRVESYSVYRFLIFFE